MRLTIWNNPVTAPVLEGLKDAFGDSVSGAPRDQVLADLKSGLTDVALIPTDVAFSSSDEFDLLPAVAISSWNNPFAWLKVETGLSVKELKILHSEEGKLSALLSAIVLKEHYGISAALSEQDEMPAGMRDYEILSVEDGGDVEAVKDSILLDLGQEWFEMANYPFVWALFAMRKGEADSATIEAIRDAVISIDLNRVGLVSRWKDDVVMESYFLNDLRLRLDDLAVASLVELSEHLYYVGATTDLQPVVFASLPDEAAGEKPS